VFFHSDNYSLVVYELLATAMWGLFKMCLP